MKLLSWSSHRAVGCDVSAVKPQGWQVFLCRTHFILWAFSNHFWAHLIRSKATNLQEKSSISILQTVCRNPEREVTCPSGKARCHYLAFWPLEQELSSGRPESTRLHRWAALRPSTSGFYSTEHSFILNFWKVYCPLPASGGLMEDLQRILPATSRSHLLVAWVF